MIVEDDDENGNILTDISYDENGHELSEVTYDESNQITSREDYTYDDDGNRLPGQSTSEDSRQSDTYDEYGNLLTYSYSYGTGDECHVEQYGATSIPVK